MRLLRCLARTRWATATQTAADTLAHGRSMLHVHVLLRLLTFDSDPYGFDNEYFTLLLDEKWTM